MAFPPHCSQHFFSSSEFPPPSSPTFHWAEVCFSVSPLPVLKPSSPLAWSQPYKDPLSHDVASSLVHQACGPFPLALATSFVPCLLLMAAPCRAVGLTFQDKDPRQRHWLPISRRSAGLSYPTACWLQNRQACCSSRSFSLPSDYRAEWLRKSGTSVRWNIIKLV